MKRISVVMLLCACLCVLAGCSDPYGACVKASADIAGGIGQGMNTVAQLQQNGAISSSEALSAINYLEFANQADEAFLSCAQTAHASPSKAGAFTACATTFNAALNNPNELALVKISNPNASATVNTVVEGVTAGVSTLAAALGGK